MYLTLGHIVRWSAISVLELFIHTVALTIFLVLTLLREEKVVDISWWIVFLPLFIADGLVVYFSLIVSMRLYFEDDSGYTLKTAIFRFITAFTAQSMIFICQLFSCQKLSGDKNYSYTEVFAPILILLHIFTIRACALNCNITPPWTSGCSLR